MFLVVLSISVSLGSRTTSTDIQIVNNLRNEKKAFFFAEAGISEARLRLGMKKPTNVTIDGVTFDAAIVPDRNDPAWKGYVLFGATSPSKSGSTFSTPTLQPAAGRFPYSTGSITAETLSLDFERCAAISLPGCTAPGAIRIVSGKPVVRIRSTGAEGIARRTVTVYGKHDPGGAGFLVLGDIPKAVECSGSCNLNFTPGTLHVNSSMPNAINTSGTGSITGAAVNVLGNCSGTCNVSPLNTNVPPLPDPLAHLRTTEPARPGSLPVRSDAGALLLPGYYPNGITVSSTAKTVAPGLYVLGPGQKLTVSGGGSLTETLPGVTFFGDQFVISGGSTINLTAPATGSQKGILFWQSAASNNKMVFSGGSAGTIDGAIYLPNAMLELSGGSGTMRLEFVVNELRVSGSSSIGQVANPVVGGGPKYEVLAWSDFQ